MIGDELTKVLESMGAMKGDLQDIRLKLNLLEKPSGWIGADGSLSVPFMRAENAEFGIMPGGYLSLSMSGTQSIPNNTLTTVIFDSWGKSPYFEWDATNYKLIYKFNTEAHSLAMMGIATFAANTAGLRDVAAIGYNDADAVIDTTYLIRITPGESTSATIPFAFPYNLGSSYKKLRLCVTQTSGGALDLTCFRLGLWVVK